MKKLFLIVLLGTFIMGSPVFGIESNMVLDDSIHSFTIFSTDSSWTKNEEEIPSSVFSSEQEEVILELAQRTTLVVLLFIALSGRTIFLAAICNANSNTPPLHQSPLQIGHSSKRYFSFPK